MPRILTDVTPLAVGFMNTAGQSALVWKTDFRESRFMNGATDVLCVLTHTNVDTWDGYETDSGESLMCVGRYNGRGYVMQTHGDTHSPYVGNVKKN